MFDFSEMSDGQSPDDLLPKKNPSEKFYEYHIM